MRFRRTLALASTAVAARAAADESSTEDDSTGSPRPRAKRGSLEASVGSSVDPGTPLTKAQLEARRDSLLDSRCLDGQCDPKTRAKTPTIRDNFAELAIKMRLDNPQLDIFNSEPNDYSSDDFIQGRPPWNLRGLILLAIMLLLVVGSTYTLLEYLLSMTRVAAMCTPSTVYIPVTRYASASAASAPELDNSTTRLTVYSTTTAMETMTSYVTMQPAVVATGLTSSGGPSYYFTTNSAGSTDWLNGISPPATASLTVITRSIFVTPVMPTDSLSTTTATITSTALVQQTITLPAYTSTEYSVVEPDTTLTSTSTHYVTYTVSEVAPSASSADAPGPHASYAGMGTSGWNSSTANMPGPTGVAAAAQDPQLTTMTEIDYFGDGEKTTSTRFSLITTSIQVAYTTVISPSIPEPSDSPEIVTTVTALPATITYEGQDGYSTSIAFSTSSVAPIASSSSKARSSPYQTGVSSVSSLTGTGISPASAAPQVPSSGIYTNVTEAPTVPAATYSPDASSQSNSSSSAVITSKSIAGPVSGSLPASSAMVSSSLGTAPGPISSPIILSSISTVSASTMSASTTSASTTSASTTSSARSSTSSLSSASSSASSPSALPQVSNSANATSATTSAVSSGQSSSIAGSSSTSTSEALSSLLPTYGPLTSVGPATTTASSSSASATSSSVSIPVVSTISSPLATSSKTLAKPTSRTLSTSIRVSSISTSSATSSSPSASPATVSLNATVVISSASAEDSQSSGSFSVISYSQTYVPSTTSSIPGVPASAASSMPSTGCGESGDFMLDFDNLPNFTPSNRNKKRTDITQAPPIPNPYHHFTFSDGYVYAPDPQVPYEPISPPHLAVFLGNGTGMKATQAGQHTIEDGEFADGPYQASSAFWFDALSAWLGCDNRGPEVCTVVMNAYTYDAQSNDEVLSFTKNATIQPCPASKGCKLQKVEYPDTFKSVSGLQMQAFVGQEERMLFADDIHMRWTDNSCIAGLTRQRSR